MDGGVAGSGVHLDLVAGADRVLVLTLLEATTDDQAMMTMAPGSFGREIEALEAAGTRVFVRSPEAVDLTALMEVRAVPGALAMGERQGAADAAAISSFWKGGGPGGG
jgi:hypothetical protein